MHAKTDSEATSFAPSSPERNRRPMYFVQSPSRNSHESTPARSITLGSPPIYRLYEGNHSRESSTSHLSDVAALKKGYPNGVVLTGNGQNWDHQGYDEEDALLEDDELRRKGPNLLCYGMWFVIGFVLLFTMFALILWGASKPQKPKIFLRSIKFDRFGVQAGMDETGVSTDMITVKATVGLTFQNTATFFGVHVWSTPFTLSYSQLKIGSGDMEGFYQRRNSARNVSLTVIGDKIPLYGNGAPLVTPTGLTTLPVPLKLNVEIRSRAYVLGKLVKTRFVRKIECSITFRAAKMNVTMPIGNSCTYDS